MKFIMIALLILAQIPTGAQSFEETIKVSRHKVFSEINDSFKNQINSIDSATRLKYYRNYLRWLYNNIPSVNIDGYIINKDKYLLDFLLTNNKSTINQDNSKSNVFSGNWQAKGPKSWNPNSTHQHPGLGRINTIAVDPSNNNIIYVGTPSSGLFRSIDGGNNWTQLTAEINFIGISGIAIDYESDPSNRTIYILSGDNVTTSNTYSSGIFVSYDDGQNWQHTSFGINWDYLEKHSSRSLNMHPLEPMLQFAAMEDGLYRTQNGWNSFVKVKEGEFLDVVFSPAPHDYIYASTSDGKIYKSNDFGNTWIHLTEGLPKNLDALVKLCVVPNEPQNLYALFGRSRDPENATPLGNFGGFYFSDDAGNNWELRSNEPNIFARVYQSHGSSINDNYYAQLAVNPINSSIIYAGGLEIFISTDGGESWEAFTDGTYSEGGSGQYHHVDQHYLAFHEQDLYSGHDGGISILYHDEEYFVDISKGLDICQIFFMGSNHYNPDYYAIGTQDVGLNVVKDAEAFHWFFEDGSYTFFMPNTNIVVGTNYDRLRINRNDDFGKTSLPGVTISSPSEETTWAYIMCDIQNKNTIYYCYDDIYKIYGTNKASIQNLSNGQIGDFKYFTKVALDPNDTTRIYVSRKSKLYKYEKSSGEWIDISGINFPSNQYISSILISPYNNDVIWVSFNNYNPQTNKLFKTVDGGKNWYGLFNTEDYPLALPINDIAYQMGTHNRIYIATDIGIFTKDESPGSNWQEFNTGLPRIKVSDIEINYNSRKLIASTFGRGIWETDLIEDCYTSKTLTSTLFGKQEWIGSTIYISSKIINESNLTIKSSEMIFLEPGFSIQKGSTIECVIKENLCN